MKCTTMSQGITGSFWWTSSAISHCCQMGSCVQSAESGKYEQEASQSITAADEFHVNCV